MTNATRKRTRRWAWLLAPATLLLAIPAAASAAPSTQAAVAEVDEAGTFKIIEGGLANLLNPGESDSWIWFNNDRTVSYFVDVRPTAVAPGETCNLKVESSRALRKDTSGNQALDMHFTVTNIGADGPCAYDVYLSFVR
jgi:hypothetical protein